MQHTKASARLTVADLDGGANPPGVPTYDFATFSQKLHEIERIWTLGVHIAHAALDPPMVKEIWCNLVPYPECEDS